MKRILIIFAVLIVGLSVALGLKVCENRQIALRPAGGSGVVEGTEVDIVSRISSRIVKVRVKEGDKVKAGEVLVELDCRENQALLAAAESRLIAAQSSAAAAQSQVNAALGSAQAATAGVKANRAQAQALQANREATSRQARRIEQLQGKGGATASDLDQVTTQVKNLSDQIRALEAQTSAARGQAAAARAGAQVAHKQAEVALAAITAAKAEVERTRTLVEECRLTAPLSGRVQTRAYEPGEVVLPGTRILTVVALDEVKTIFYIPNRELAAAAPQRSVTVIADAYPGQRFSGAIVSISSEAEFTPRNVQTREDRDRLVYAVEVRVPNPEGKLRPGMPVEVTIDGTGKGSE